MTEPWVGAAVPALRPRARPYDGRAPATVAVRVQLARPVAPTEADAWRAELAAQGVAILGPDRPWGHRTRNAAAQGRKPSTPAP